MPLRNRIDSRRDVADFFHASNCLLTRTCHLISVTVIRVLKGARGATSIDSRHSWPGPVCRRTSRVRGGLPTIQSAQDRAEDQPKIVDLALLFIGVALRAPTIAMGLKP